MFKLGTLEIQYGTMLIQLICFLVLLWLVKIFAMKPAMKVLSARQEHISDQISSAEEANREAARLVEEQRKVLEDAKKEAYELIERAKVQKDRDAEQIIKAAQERAERIMNEASLEIVNEKNKAIAELREQVGTLSVMLAAKIIEKQLNDAEQQKTIDEFLSQAGGQL